MKNVNLVDYVVRDESGSIDETATVEKFRQDLNEYVAKRESSFELVSDAEQAVREASPSFSAWTKGLLTDKIFSFINPSPDDAKSTKELVKSYLDSKYESHKGRGALKLRATAVVE